MTSDDNDRRNAVGGTGLYVHVPFCRQLCPYCDFAVAVRREPPHEAYCDALRTELEARSGELISAPTTIYFGGGTPAMFALDQLARFLEAVDTSHTAEMTIEANPLDITSEQLDAWHGLGFDRVSLGVQSFDDDALEGLGRDHDGAAARDAVAMLVGDRRFRVSVDLIYGGPRHTREVMAADLATIDTLRPEHVSGYELTIEPGTVFGRKHRAGVLALPPEGDVVDRGLELVERLGALGYERYEVSSFGRDGDRALHNSGYWLGRPYLGLGTGAHSLDLRDGVVRRENPRQLNAYLAAPSEPAEVEHLDVATYLGERLMLAARTRLGVDPDQLRLGAFRDAVMTTWSRLQAEGLFEPESVLRPTLAGLEVADVIAQRFWDATHPDGEPG